MIPDMQPQMKTRPLIRCLKRGEHLEEITQRILLSRHDATTSFRAGELGKHFRHVIRHRAILDVCAQEYASHQHIEIEVRRHTQATAAFQQRVEQGRVVEDLVAGIFVSKEADEAFGVAEFRAEHGQDERHIFSGELHAAIGLYDFHRVHHIRPWISIGCDRL